MCSEREADVFLHGSESGTAFPEFFVAVEGTLAQSTMKEQSTRDNEFRCLFCPVRSHQVDIGVHHNVYDRNGNYILQANELKHNFKREIRLRCVSAME